MGISIIFQQSDNNDGYKLLGILYVPGNVPLYHQAS